MSRPNLLFSLFTKDKKPLYVDAMGFIQEADPATFQKPDGSAAHLQKSPDGWKGVLIKYGRNIKYWGVFRDFTVPMDYKGDGARIVSNAMWNQQSKGIEEVLYLGIHKLNKFTFPCLYEVEYSGENDLSKVKQKKDGITVNVMEGGLSKLLKAFESTVYEIDIDQDDQAVNVTMDGLNFKATNRYELAEVSFAPNGYFFIGINYLTSEGTAIGVTNYSVFQRYSGSSSPDYVNYTDYFFATQYAKTVRFVFKLNVYVPPTTPGGNLRFYFHTQTRELQIFPRGTLSTGVNELSFDMTWDLLAGEHVFLVGDSNTSTLSPIFFFVSDFTVQYINKYKTTVVKGLKPLRLWQKLVEKMSNGLFTGGSSFLLNMDDLVMTSASALRNHEGDSSSTASGSTIKISIADFYKAFGRFSVGLGIESDKLTIEQIQHFFGSTIALQLGEVTDFECTVAEDLIYNTVKVGYKNNTYDSVNGLDEFNVEQRYTSPLTRIVKELDLISPVRADMYGAELIRVNLDGKNTTDNDSDNDPFFLSVQNPVTLAPSFVNAIKFTPTGIQNPMEFGFFSANPDVTETATEITYIGTATRTLKISGTIRFDAYDAGLLINIFKNGVAKKTYHLDVNSISKFIDFKMAVQTNDVISIGVTGATTATIIQDATITLDFISQTTYELRRDAYTIVSGLIEPATAFNVELSPKRSLINNGPLLHSMNDKQDSEFITFQTGDKNSLLSTTNSAGVTVTENSNLQIANLGAKLFLPYYFSFTTTVPLNFKQIMDADPYGRISFIFNGNTYTGFLWDGGINPGVNNKQTWKLLACPDNDMSKLITQ